MIKNLNRDINIMIGEKINESLDNISNSIEDILNQSKDIQNVLNKQNEKLDNISNDIGNTNDKLDVTKNKINEIIRDERLNFINGLSAGIIIGSTAIGAASLFSSLSFPIIGISAITITSVIIGIVTGGNKK
jgi:hypothetical protein